MAISRAFIASLLISLLVLQLVEADVIVEVPVKNGAGSRVDRTFVTERAGLAAPGATVCHQVRTETTTSVRATPTSPPTVVAASALK
ncbi:hypothetical protein Bca101_027818 [Brassica carinata]